MLESGVLRRVFGPKQVTGDWRLLYSEELMICTFLLDIIRVSNQGG